MLICSSSFFITMIDWLIFFVYLSVSLSFSIDHWFIYWIIKFFFAYVVVFFFFFLISFKLDLMIMMIAFMSKSWNMTYRSMVNKQTGGTKKINHTQMRYKNWSTFEYYFLISNWWNIRFFLVVEKNSLRSIIVDIDDSQFWCLFIVDWNDSQKKIGG